MLVCICNNVSDKEIREDIGDARERASTCCGICEEEVQKIIEESDKEEEV